GAAHLDDDLAPVLQQGRVHLGDRGARKRLSVDAGEGIGAKLLVDRLPNLLKCNGGSGIYQLRELVDVNIRKEIRPRGQQLAELDVRRPELFQSLAKFLRRFARRRPVADDADLAEDANQLAPPRDSR